MLQAAAHEPSARHALLAISSLYEKFDQNTGTGLPALRDCSDAIANYNLAIRHLTTVSTLHPDTVLTISILFICIEFLRGNVDAAIRHCRHGIQISNSFHPDSDVQAIFQHLSIFPFFFGASPSEFPPLVHHNSPPSRFPSQTESDMRQHLDSIMSQAVKLVTTTVPYRLGIAGTESASLPLILEQQLLDQQLDEWYSSFQDFRGKRVSKAPCDSFCRSMEVRWLVCKIWNNICFGQTETVTDAYKDEFERIIELSQQEAAYRKLVSKSPAKFLFTMGFAPLLHFVAIKCRYLPLRLAALSLTKALSGPRESMWDTNILYATGTRIVEYEHGLTLTPEMLSQPKDISYAVPDDSRRVRHSFLEDEMMSYINQDGLTVTQQRICLFVPESDGSGVCPYRDWITFGEMGSSVFAGENSTE